MSESKSLLAKIFSSLIDAILDNLGKIFKKKTEKYLSQLIKSLAITLTGVVLLILGLAYVLLGVVRHLTDVLGTEALAYGIVGIISSLIGAILVLLAMPRR